MSQCTVMKDSVFPSESVCTLSIPKTVPATKSQKDQGMIINFPLVLKVWLLQNYVSLVYRVNGEVESISRYSTWSIPKT